MVLPTNHCKLDETLGVRNLIPPQRPREWLRSPLASRTAQAMQRRTAAGYTTR